MSQLRQVQRTVSILTCAGASANATTAFENSLFSFLHFAKKKYTNHRHALKLRESDYAVITREFEDHVDEKVLEAVRNASATALSDSITNAATAANANAIDGASAAAAAADADTGVAAAAADADSAMAASGI